MEKEKAPLPPLHMNLNTFFPLALQLCDFLQQRSQGQADKESHRPFRPECVLFSEDSQNLSFRDQSLFSSMEADLRYVAPEQTGRLKQGSDCRTDLYSLGALLYEMLTGLTPFEKSGEVAMDPMALIHAHLAQTPDFPSEKNLQIPHPLSQILLKLLEKSPEQRYQSVTGLQHDLLHCHKEWNLSEVIAEFDLGQQDVSEHLILPSTLYGRDTVLEQWLEDYEDLKKEQILMLISGYLGVGKSAFVQKLQEHFESSQTRCIYGKCEAYKQAAPYSPVIQAFQKLIHQLLQEAPEELAHWKKRLLDALKGNGSLMIQLFPELELFLT